VAARTYAMAKILKYEEKKPENHPKAPVCSTTHCQVYKTEKKLIADHEEGWEKTGWEKIQKACHATEGQLLYYDGKLVMQPLFFSSSGGQTENSEDVFVSAYPYLVSVASPYEDKATHRDEETVLDIKDFAEKLKNTYPQRDLGKISRDTIKILGRTAGGRVERMQVGSGKDGVMKGTEVRTALGLSSALFSISFREDSEIVFTSSGSGHGVGMSQYGADGMAKEGYNYVEILEHYYSGSKVG
ncbi:MAG: stage II sporulation protein D, partial [Firmicutes bacterium]|nr:stage II sporulation protein D [Bacillota bacterium]